MPRWPRRRLIRKSSSRCAVGRGHRRAAMVDGFRVDQSVFLPAGDRAGRLQSREHSENQPRRRVRSVRVMEFGLGLPSDRPVAICSEVPKSGQCGRSTLPATFTYLPILVESTPVLTNQISYELSVSISSRWRERRERLQTPNRFLAGDCSATRRMIHQLAVNHREMARQRCHRAVLSTSFLSSPAFLPPVLLP